MMMVAERRFVQPDVSGGGRIQGHGGTAALGFCDVHVLHCRHRKALAGFKQMKARLIELLAV